LYKRIQFAFVRKNKKGKIVMEYITLARVVFIPFIPNTRIHIRSMALISYRLHGAIEVQRKITGLVSQEIPCCHKT
jgi:hypothetical protein